MVSLVPFVIVLIIIFILLIIASIYAAIAAGQVFDSALYPTEPKLKDAHSLLVWAAVMGLITVFLIIIVMVVAFATGFFTAANFTNLITSSQTPTQADLAIIFSSSEKLKAEIAASIWILVLLFILVILTVVVGILCWIASSDINSSPVKDDDVNKAYNSAIIATVTSIAGLFFVILGLIVFFYFRSQAYAAQKQAEDIELNARGSRVTEVVKAAPVQPLPLQVSQVSQPVVITQASPVISNPLAAAQAPIAVAPVAAAVPAPVFVAQAPAPTAVPAPVFVAPAPAPAPAAILQPKPAPLRLSTEPLPGTVPPPSPRQVQFSEQTLLELQQQQAQLAQQQANLQTQIAGLTQFQKLFS